MKIWDFDGLQWGTATKMTEGFFVVMVGIE